MAICLHLFMLTTVGQSRNACSDACHRSFNVLGTISAVNLSKLITSGFTCCTIICVSTEEQARVVAATKEAIRSTANKKMGISALRQVKHHSKFMHRKRCLDSAA